MIPTCRKEIPISGTSNPREADRRTSSDPGVTGPWRTGLAGALFLALVLATGCTAMGPALPRGSEALAVARTLDGDVRTYSRLHGSVPFGDPEPVEALRARSDGLALVLLGSDRRPDPLAGWIERAEARQLAVERLAHLQHFAEASGVELRGFRYRLLLVEPEQSVDRIVDSRADDRGETPLSFYVRIDRALPFADWLDAVLARLAHETFHLVYEHAERDLELEEAAAYVFEQCAFARDEPLSGFRDVRLPDAWAYDGRESEIGTMEEQLEAYDVASVAGKLRAEYCIRQLNRLSPGERAAQCATLLRAPPRTVCASM